MRVYFNTRSRVVFGLILVLIIIFISFLGTTLPELRFAMHNVRFSFGSEQKLIQDNLG
jgi:hypothetical protein